MPSPRASGSIGIKSNVFYQKNHIERTQKAFRLTRGSLTVLHFLDGRQTTFADERSISSNKLPVSYQL